jgi:hypothetical protein
MLGMFLTSEGPCAECLNKASMPAEADFAGSADMLAPFNMLAAISAYCDAGESVEGALAAYMNTQRLDKSITPAISEPGFLSDVASALFEGRTSAIPVTRSGSHGCTPDKEVLKRENQQVTGF